VTGITHERPWVGLIVDAARPLFFRRNAGMAKFAAGCATVEDQGERGSAADQESLANHLRRG
jgi:hypothetical protein